MYVLKELIEQLVTSGDRQTGLVKVADMYVAFVQMCKRDELDAILAEVLTKEPRVDHGQPVEEIHGEDHTEHKGENGLERGIFRILEARETSSGAVRAYCQVQDGNKVAVFGKNDVGKQLTESIGKDVKIDYRKGDKGLIAIRIG